MNGFMDPRVTNQPMARNGRPDWRQLIAAMLAGASPAPQYGRPSPMAIPRNAMSPSMPPMGPAGQAYAMDARQKMLAQALMKR